MLGKPEREIGLGDFAGGEPPERQNTVLFRRCYLEAVQAKEGEGDNESRALVAVHEGVICDNSFGIRGSEFGQRGRSIGIRHPVLRTGERGVQQTEIPHTLRTSMQQERFFVHSQNRVLPDPDWLAHSASLCRTSRFSRMISLAASI
jgi:hypothetical protein